MKKTRVKNIFRSVKGTLTRFLAILFIVALGAGFMAGLAATSPDMYETADGYMDDYNWYDFNVVSTLGFSDEDVEKLSSLDFVDVCQSSVVYDMILRASNEKSYTTRVFGFLDKDGNSPMNNISLKSGRMPQNKGECVIQQTMAKYFGDGVQIGDTLVISSENTNYDTLTSITTETRLTVVGFCESPMLMSLASEASTVGSGSIDMEVFVMEDYYDADYYTNVYLTVSGAKELVSFDDEYYDLIDPLTETLENLGKERAEIRTNEVKNEAQKQVDNLKKSLDLIDKVVETGTALAEDDVLRLQQNAQVSYAVMGKNPELAALLSKTSDEIIAALKNASSPDTSTVKEKLAEKIADAEKEVADISDATWVVQTRKDSASYKSYEENVGKVAALSKIFPAFFFIVALLVALTTMTRLVEETRGQIGTLKALGFSNMQILSEYMLYSLSSSVLGCILGFAVGFRLFPKAISSAYAMLYIIPDCITPIRPEIIAWVAPVTIGSILLATLWATWAEFRETPASLMQPKAPAAGKRIFLEHIPFVWNKLSFTKKVTCRNIFRYKKRLFMTIVGVAGCSALLLTGFGLKDSINDIVDKQFGEIYKYELTIMTDSAKAPSDEALQSILNDKSFISNYAHFSQESGKAKNDKDSQSLTICVPEKTETLTDFVTLRERKSGKTFSLSESGVVLTEKLCEQLNLKVGDVVTLENADGKRAEFEVSGITENYIVSFAFVSPAAYEKAFGNAPDFDVVLCTMADGVDSSDALKKVMASDSVIYTKSSLDLKDNFNDSIKSIDGVILVLILSAGLLSIVVLYNLTNVNICERRKELATIRVLGFHEREVEQYIFREINVLSLLGTIVGLLVGVWLHSFVIRTVEIDMVMFGRTVYPLSYLYAFAVSMVFTFLVNIIMKSKIKNIDMVEAMKANE